MPLFLGMRQGWRFGSKVLLPVSVVTIGAVALVAFGLFWATSQSDKVSVERQIRTTRHAIDTSIDELAHDQETVAVWDDHVVELNKSNPDWQWVNDNIGVWLHDLFGHDQVYIIDPNDKPVYAMIAGVRVSADRYAVARPDLQLLVDVVRGRRSGSNGRHDRNAGKPLAFGNTVQTSEKAVHDSHLMQVLNRPAAVSAMRIVPLTDAVTLKPGREHIIISVRFLDGAFLRDLSSKNLIAAPRFSRSAIVGPYEQALPLRTEHGQLIGYFAWRPELPGTRLMKILGPMTILAALALISAMALLARSLWRSTQDLQATLIELQASEAQAQHLAFHDVLTGLPNRALFNDRLDLALLRARRGEKIALLMLDLDRFKHVNDTLGHHAGDALIREFSARLAGLLRSEDTVARLGGDEFAILQVGIGSNAEAEQLCSDILASVRQPFDVIGNHAFVGVSIGVVFAPDAGLDRVDLMRKADIALYQAKADGRDCHRLFTGSMDETVKLRGTVEEELRAALATGDGLQVYYQPQVAAVGQPIVGLEALVRWQHATRGLITPEQFISVAEDSGLICQLGDWVLRQACATSRRWPQLSIAVNLSPVQLRASGFAERLLEIIGESGADFGRIELEVTESILLDDDEVVREALRRLRAAGLKIALDDFGTGYSSLSYLRRFDVDKIKIDRSFIQHLGCAADSAAIITAIVTLGHAMGLAVTAEGVETKEQHRFLSAAGCNEMQGFLFSRPLPEEEVAMLLENQGRTRDVA